MIGVSPTAPEIERKFLVRSFDDITSDPSGTLSEGTSIIQGYLSPPGSRDSLRVRIRAGSAHATLTLKGPRSNITREETQSDIARPIGLHLMDAAKTAVVWKTRYEYKAKDGHIWDVDQFHGPNSGLIMAEIELASESESFAVPAWCYKEVTYDTGYYNESLARHPVGPIL